MPVYRTSLAVAALVFALAAAAFPAEAGPSTAVRAGVSLAADGAAASPPVPMPRNPDGLPAPTNPGKQVDAFAGYQGQIACLTTPSVGLVRLRALALSTYGRGGSSPASTRACSSGSTSEHKDGRAWDWMLNHGNVADRRAAADFLSWVTGRGPSGVRGEMAARLGIMYVIFNHRSWSSYNREWQTYSGYDPHTSHIHISLSWNGARAQTSFWTGRVWPADVGPCQVFTGQPGVVPGSRARTQPCDRTVMSPRGSTMPFSWFGGAGSTVAAAQRSLGVSATGSFDITTRRAVLRFQAQHDLPRTGALDKPTWAALRPSSARLNAPDWTKREALDWARDEAGSPRLQRMNAGREVYALQVALQLPTVGRTGFFGATTADTVITLKRANGLAANSIVNPAVWSLIAGDDNPEGS